MLCIIWTIQHSTFHRHAEITFDIDVSSRSREQGPSLRPISILSFASMRMIGKSASNGSSRNWSKKDFWREQRENSHSESATARLRYESEGLSKRTVTESPRRGRHIIRHNSSSTKRYTAYQLHIYRPARS